MVEAMAALHAMAEPRHHPMHHDWLRTVRRRMTAPMRQETAGFRFGAAAFLAAVLVPAVGSTLGGSPLGFDAELELLRSHRDELGRQILRALAGVERTQGKDLHDPMVQAVILRDSARLGPVAFQLVQVGLADPGRLGDRLLDLLDDYWNRVGFRHQWAAVEPQLVEAATAASLAVNGTGTRGLLALLSERLASAATTCAGAAFDLPVPCTDESKPALLASAHLWPHACVVHGVPGTVCVIYPVAAGAAPPAQPDPLADLLPLLRGLDDSTRLRVLWLVREGPRSTQELAPLLGISQAAASKHLRLLAAAGLVESRREGAYVLYRLVPSSLERIFHGLNGLLTRPAGDTGSGPAPTPR